MSNVLKSHRIYGETFKNEPSVPNAENGTFLSFKTFRGRTSPTTVSRGASRN